jgi:hypothetical protein
MRAIFLALVFTGALTTLLCAQTPQPTPLPMDFSDYDRTPMFELNEVIWKRVRGAKSEMPLHISRFHFRAE